tara:strand:- start:15 stop:665 length:651 start_codon:yes stop_codon:yes gene_type:complete
MYLDKRAIKNIERIRRVNLMNSITGIKSVNLIGTIDEYKVTNLAIFSSVVHISSSPPIFGFFVRTNKKVKRDTFENILLNNEYTINHIHQCTVDNSHFTSAKFDKDVSEFKVCNFNEQYIDNFSAPFVAESNIKMGLKLKEVIDFKSNQSKLVIGEIEHIFIKQGYLESDNVVNLEKSNSVCVSGLNTYYLSKKLKKMTYARVNDLKQQEFYKKNN